MTVRLGQIIPCKIRVVALGFVLSAIAWKAYRILTNYDDDKFVAVNVLGVQHMGMNFKIDEFYIDRGSYGSAGRERDAGAFQCCMRLPKEWHPGMTVDLRWEISDWSQADPQQIDAGDLSSVTNGGIYKAIVPIEKYTTPGDIYVHFFLDKKVRIVVSNVLPESKRHPIPFTDEPTNSDATVGKKVTKVFTPLEMAELRKKRDEDKRKFGDWR
ncbi:MAG: DUF3304 domain-containing protein [Pseudomonadota bacterium]